MLDANVSLRVIGRIDDADGVSVAEFESLLEPTNIAVVFWSVEVELVSDTDTAYTEPLVARSDDAVVSDTVTGKIADADGVSEVAVVFVCDVKNCAVFVSSVLVATGSARETGRIDDAVSDVLDEIGFVTDTPNTAPAE